MQRDLIIIGGGISGLTLALSLHELGIACRIYESASSFKRLGVGINLQPHGVRELTELGLQPALARVGVETREMSYYTRHGQFIFTEPRGRFAGYPCRSSQFIAANCTGCWSMRCRSGWAATPSR